MRLRNINPQGRIDLPLIGRALDVGEEFDVDDEAGQRLLKQHRNYEAVENELGGEDDERMRL